MFAGVTGRVAVTISEPGESRDHTERMLRAFGYRVERAANVLTFEPTGELRPFELDVPGDPSSAAFLIGAAILAAGGEIRIAGVGCNPGRIAFLAVLQAHGALVAWRTSSSVRASRRRNDLSLPRPCGLSVPASDIPA